MNTTIVTADGDYSLKTITIDCAKDLIKPGFQSFIGHASTAEILSELLNVDVRENRLGWFPEAGESALCFKLNSRPKEGAILDRQQLEEIGFSFKLLTRTA